MGYNLRDPKQRQRYRYFLFKRRDSFFAPAHKIVKKSFAPLGTGIAEAYKAGGETAALKAVEKIDPQMRQMIYRIWEMAGNDGYKFAQETWGDHGHQKVAAWLAYVAAYMNGHTGDQIFKKLGGLSDETKDLIKKAIFSGAEQEESIPEISDRVQGVFTDMEDWRATRIARSEVVDAYNQATLQHGRDAGSTLDILWVNTDDDRTRDAHKDYPEGIGGTTISADNDDGFDCQDGTNWPGEAVNCRCCIGYTDPAKRDDALHEVTPTGAEEPTAEETPEIPEGGFADDAALDKWAEENGIATRVNFADTDLDVATDVTRSLADGLNDDSRNFMPDKLGVLTEYDPTDPNVIMSTTGFGNDTNFYVNLNNTNGDVELNVLRAQSDRAFEITPGHFGHPFNTAGYADNPTDYMDRVVDHEFGHSVFRQIGQDRPVDMVKWVDEWNANKNELAGVSDYSQKNADEGFSEMYSLYVNGDKVKIPADFLKIMDGMGLVK